MTATATVPPAGPEATPGAGERPAVTNLRAELAGLDNCDYSAIADITTDDGYNEAQAIFAKQTNAAVDYAIKHGKGDDKIEPKEAVDALFEVADPYVGQFVERNWGNYLGVTIPDGSTPAERQALIDAAKV